jgi:hypothetical protein
LAAVEPIRVPGDDTVPDALLDVLAHAAVRGPEFPAVSADVIVDVDLGNDRSLFVSPGFAVLNLSAYSEC